MKHLWEVQHPYYCNEGNYFARESVCDYFKSWDDFVGEYGDSDLDMNLLFRWDWEERDEDTEGPTFNGDVNYRNGKLKVFWMGQRKGYYHYSVVEVCRADEPAVLEFLRPRLKHMLRLWAPIAPEETSEAEAALPSPMNAATQSQIAAVFVATAEREGLSADQFEIAAGLFLRGTPIGQCIERAKASTFDPNELTPGGADR